MKITPIDIAHKAFNKKMFGLDENQVLDFLQQIAATMEDLIHERNSLKELVREKEISVNELRERDQILKTTIATASQMADRLRHDADREARLIVADAQQNLKSLLGTQGIHLKTYTELSELKRARMQFEANLKALAQAHITLLEQGEKFMPNIGMPNMNIEGSPTLGHRTTEISPLSSEQL